jgi:hypothetical protein
MACNFAAGTCLPSRCLVLNGGIHITEPLPSNDRGIHIQTHRMMGEIYKVRRSDGLSCRHIHAKFHTRLAGGYTERQECDFISVRLYFQNMESGLKRECAHCMREVCQTDIPLLFRWGN